MPDSREGSKRKADDDGPTNGKKTKADTKDSIAFEAWEHYRNYIDSVDQGEDCEDDGGDIDELLELIEMLSQVVPEPPSVDPNMYGEATTAESMCKKYRTIKDLLPVLISMAYLHLGSRAISQDIDSEGEERPEYSCDTKSPEDYLNSSIRYFPANAAATSLLANYHRMKLLSSIERICDMYVLASRNAHSVRCAAVSLLGDGDEHSTLVQDDVKEWIELLLLNGVASAEYLEEEEEEEKKEGNRGEEGKIEGEQFDAEKTDETSHEDEVSGSEVEATASFMASLLLSTLGRHSEALDHLRKFGFTHRVHPNVWSKKYSLGDASMGTVMENEQRCCDASISLFEPRSYRADNGVLPPKLYRSLCNMFRPSAAYWRESDYDHRGYYSYFLDLTDEVKASPRNMIEDVIVNHLLPLATKVLPDETKDKIVGAEWWTHHRPIQANLGHQLHFDTDEALLDQEQAITHPVLSSVLYLTGGESTVTADGTSPAGSTIVFEQLPDSKNAASKAWISHARDNSYMAFPGNLLHGVLPCPGGRAKEDGTEEKNSVPNHRLTFMVGFWTRRVPDKMKERRLYGPCGPLPPPTEEHSWVKEIAKGYDKKDWDQTDTNGLEISFIPLPTVTPAWEQIEGWSASCLQVPKSLDHRFFVKNAPHCFRESLFNKDEHF